MDCDIVIQGGGVKGVALAGGVYGLEAAGYKGKNFAGTSAGSMIAAMLSAGYTAEEIKTELQSFNYKKCMGEDFIDKLGIAGKGASLFKSYGIYNCDYIEEFMKAKLAKKGKIVFGDLPRWTPNGQSKKPRLYNLCVTTTDLTTGKLLVLPDDLCELGIDPGSFPIAKAVRASISFPLFYEPLKLKDVDGKTHYLVDGGLISSYPMFILDDGKSQLIRPAIGVRLAEGEGGCPHGANCKRKENFIEYLKSIVFTLLDVADEIYTERAKGDRERSMFVSSTVDGKPIETMNFNLSKRDADKLFENGQNASAEFVRRFNFTDWHT